jgi:hypothetical protein
MMRRIAVSLTPEANAYLTQQGEMLGLSPAEMARVILHRHATQKAVSTAQNGPAFEDTASLTTEKASVRTGTGET